MSVTHLEKQSHISPNDYRINYEDAKLILENDSNLPQNDSLPPIHSKSKICIIGGGFSGISVALTCINKLNTEDFVLFDKHSNFGGTWWANTYPGCASDIPALWYSYFNELNDNWSRLQPPQYEMEEYILKVVEKHQIRKYAKFKTIVTKAKYNEEEANWTIFARDITNGQQLIHTSKMLVSGQGVLVRPFQLNSKGLDDFEGEYMHSAIWNHNVSFKGKKVVVVGNGCSANQVIPALLKDYEVESIFQVSRSKHYILPPVPAFVYAMYQWLSFFRFGLIITRWILAAVAEARFPLFKGEGYVARIVRWINKAQSVHYMKKAPKKYHDMIIPDFKVGCKRLIFDHNYIPSLHDPRMDLTNESIDHITKDSVILTDGREIKADIIVACTGYDINRGFHSYSIIGRNNIDINKIWEQQGVSAYRTTLLRDCPNMFLISGPNSATGHSSVVLACENTTVYFSKIASKILSGAYKSICVKTEKYNEWFQTTQGELKRSVFGSEFGGCNSWYTKGGINSTAYPYSQIYYWWDMRHPKWKDFEIHKSSLAKADKQD